MVNQHKSVKIKVDHIINLKYQFANNNEITIYLDTTIISFYRYVIYSYTNVEN